MLRMKGLIVQSKQNEDIIHNEENQLLQYLRLTNDRFERPGLFGSNYSVKSEG